MILTPTIPAHTNRNADSPHHRLLEAVKTALIKIFVSPYATVCNFCSNILYLCVICIAEECRMKRGGTKLKSATSSELMKHHLELEKSEKHGKVNARLTLPTSMNLIPALRTWKQI